MHCFIGGFEVARQTCRPAGSRVLLKYIVRLFWGRIFIIAYAEQELKLQESNIFGADFPKPPDYCACNGNFKTMVRLPRCKIVRKTKRFDQKVSELVVHTTFT